MDAITASPTLSLGKFDWTITDVIDERESETPYVFGKLAKYAKDGHATVIDEKSKSQVDADVPNLLIASSPFLYLPEFSGIAYLHVWNQVEEQVFTRRFKSIIEEAYGRFFVHCDIEAVADYETFTARLRKLDVVNEIKAKVQPPNPMFGRLWAGLNQYIDERNAEEVQVKEKASTKMGLNSSLVELMEQLLESPDYEPDEPPAIGDAAILMAADGYGKGQVSGLEDGTLVFVKTSDARKSFVYSRDPVPTELASKVEALFIAITKERDMKH
ncbi:hypothetical protein [Thalassospira lucentensis]|uniref:hypothetical protein n=1 Tax=Thalassospira lucentensis TaxID=168935 RepID=UPI003AA9CEE7